MTPFGEWRPFPTRKKVRQWEGIKNIMLGMSWSDLGEVNSDVNTAWTYQREDGDSWQSPHDMMVSGKGDCEDFAILKRAIIGRGEIIIGQDNILGGNHAVLFVDGVVMDCTHDRLLKPEEMPHFKPTMGMDAFRYWIFGRET